MNITIPADIVRAMKFVLLFCVINIILAKESKEKKEKKCDGVEINGKFHKNVVLAKGLDRPYQLSCFKKKNEVFFTYNIGNFDEDTFELGYVKENDTEHKKITDVINGFATAMDDKNEIVYFGGTEGVYERSLKGENNETKHIIKHRSIWDMFFKDHLYFIDYPKYYLYKYDCSKNKTAERHKKIHEKIIHFVIDGEDDIFITNKTGLYIIKNGSEHRHLIDGPKVFRQIEVNNKGVAHFCGQNAIYVAHKHNHTLHKIADVKNIFGLTFDSDDNFIYSNPHQIVKLEAADCKEDDVPFVPVPIP